jgi:enoyl-CoA hydratase/carnithine racemase
MSVPVERALISETVDGLTTITFNRPARLNAWTPSMEHELHESLMLATADSSVRAIVLTGAGRGFCAGADMSNLEGVASGAIQLPPIDPALQGGDFERRYSYLLAVPKPIVAAINGAAAGVGFVLTLFCDLRYVAEGAKMTAIFARRGLVAEHGAAWMLPRLIGPMAALDLLLSGRSVEADEAHYLGLARKLPSHDFLHAVQGKARELVSRSSPRSIAIIKRQVHQAWMQQLAAAVAEAEHEQVASLRSEDFKEGIAHFLERREPRFTGY